MREKVVKASYPMVALGGRKNELPYNISHN